MRLHERKRNCLPVFAVLAAIALAAGGATAAPGYYTLNFSATNCVEDPDDSNGAIDYTAYGMWNESTSSTAYVYCPLDWINTLQVDGNTTDYRPEGTTYWWARVDVMDTDDLYQIGCRAYASDALDGDANDLFDYEYSPWYYSGVGDTGPETFSIRLDSEFADDVKYMFLYCFLEKSRESPYMAIIGYRTEYSSSGS